ncbi:3-hydroxybutyrate dehydrogenase type 2 [Diplodia seriata]|uniref:3-hydroxybutyrate dehydrogenase type 2 n=1 Tax=Diplodia seriata TaxID=420778 RepID=A0A1S8BJA6_9PEZI|nr:3-hydroxybutyrate dehydrogenase type 2 [Diplodia seriata]
MFNNAGIMHALDGDALGCAERVWDATMAVNAKGVWWGSKHAVRGFREMGKRGGSVVNTASMVALVGSAAAQLAYTASKGAVVALTRELAVVHAREGFRFNALCPAPLHTPMLQEFFGDDKAKRFRREVRFLTGRFGETVEQAHAVVFLASDESSFVNGTDFVVDGGLTKAYVTTEAMLNLPPYQISPQRGLRGPRLFSKHKPLPRRYTASSTILFVNYMYTRADMGVLVDWLEERSNIFSYLIVNIAVAIDACHKLHAPSHRRSPQSGKRPAKPFLGV